MCSTPYYNILKMTHTKMIKWNPFFKKRLIYDKRDKHDTFILKVASNLEINKCMYFYAFYLHAYLPFVFCLLYIDVDLLFLPGVDGLVENKIRIWMFNTWSYNTTPYLKKWRE